MEKSRLDNVKPPFRVIIAGSRGFDDFKLLCRKCDLILSEKVVTHDICIVSGTSSGADKLGEQYAKLRGYKLAYFPAEWNLYGKRAGIIRNGQMLLASDAVIVFWDGYSRGSSHMISIAKASGKPTRVLSF